MKDMKRTNKKNNKGFSLVELIIVMAIMAILVGIVGSQVIPYIEKSKIAKDQQVLSSLCTDAVSAFAMSAKDLNPTAKYKITIKEGNTTVVEVGATGSTPGAIAVAKTFGELEGCDSSLITTPVIGLYRYGTEVKLESKDAAKGNKIITIDYDGATGLVEVFAGATAADCLKIGTITSK